MKKLAVVAVLVVVAGVLAGCPALGITTGNKLIIYNDTETSNNYVLGPITELSVVQLGAESCWDANPVGVNILDTPIKKGESFTVKGLVDGYYCITVTYSFTSGNQTIDRTKIYKQSLLNNQNLECHVNW